MENNHEKLPEQNTDLMFGDDFDMGDFSDLDGSEDDLPF